MGERRPGRTGEHRKRSNVRTRRRQLVLAALGATLAMSSIFGNAFASPRQHPSRSQRPPRRRPPHRRQRLSRPSRPSPPRRLYPQPCSRPPRPRPPCPRPPRPRPRRRSRQHRSRRRRRPRCRSPVSTWCRYAPRPRTSTPARARSVSTTTAVRPSRSRCRTSTPAGRSSGTAPPGPSTWNVPAGGGANTTELIIDGQTVVTADSTNLVCAVLDGNAQCDPASGQTTVTWTVSNNDSSAIVIATAMRVACPSPPTRWRRMGRRRPRR